MNTTRSTPQKQTSEMSGPEHTYQATYVPRFDICEREDELLLYGDLPGVLPDDLEIRFENRELTIYGKVRSRQDGSKLLYGEYDVGDFYRTFSIGEAIDSESIFAEMSNGVLTLHLPKSEKIKPRRIEVNVAS